MGLRWTTALLAIGIAACESTAPAARIDGVWASRVARSGPGDSLTLALDLNGTQVRGFAILRTSSAPQSFPVMGHVQGTFVGRSTDLALSLSGFGPVTLHISLDREIVSIHPVLSGTIEIPDSRPVTFRRVDPAARGVGGTYALVSTSAPPEVLPALHDTIIALPDGRGRRNREEHDLQFGTQTVWHRRGDWIVLDQFQFSGTLIPARDSVRVQGDVLIRTTTLSGGSVIETYERVAMP